LKGTVYQTTGLWYKVKLANNNFVQCRLKGKLRLEDLNTTNPVAVGDEVEIEKSEKDHLIINIEKRDNYIIRASPRHAKKNHIIAANIQQSLLVVSLKQPKTRQGFIDRFLVTCEMYHVPAIIVFNKKDLYKAKDLTKFEEFKTLYESLGYITLLASIEDLASIKIIKEKLVGKRTLISGQSGVGKSSILNQIESNLELATKVVSNYNEKGQHTTTYATMYDLSFDGQVIDTPGIKLMSLVNLEPEEVGHYFPEMRQLINQCKFGNCTHTNEPDCKVLEALANDNIDENRFTTYVNIYNEVKDTNYWERGV